MRGELSRRLGLVDTVGVVAGTIIGAGIFLTPSLVARQLPSPGWILGVWAFSGLLSLVGALVYAELGAMIPATGGQYVFLRECFGPGAAFLSGWASFLVILPGAVAWLAAAFADYLSHFLPLGPWSSKLAGIALLVVLTAANYRGVRVGATVQNLFAALKLAGLLALIVAAFLGPAPAVAQTSPVTSGFSPTAFGAAMVACLLTYDGWVSLSFVAGEVRRPQRNLPLGLALGLSVCVVAYLLANVAYLRVLGPAGMAEATRVGAKAADRTLGHAGGVLVTATILASIVGCANGWFLTGPRVSFAQAQDGLFFHRLAAIHPRFRTPSVSILALGAWSALLVALGAYEALGSYVMLAAWLFYGLTAAGLVRLRRREPDRPRPYRMWGGIAAALVFAAVAFGFVLNTLYTSPAPSLASLLLITAGLPAYHFWRRRKAREQWTSS